MRSHQNLSIDILLPTYNRSALLVDCLKSICRARKPEDMDVTVWIVDNNSSDATAQAVVPFLDQREITFRYLFVPRPGKSAALNEALKHAQGDIIGLIDDDEQIADSWLETVYHEFTSDPELEYIGGSVLPNWATQKPGWFPHSYGGAVSIVPRTKRVPFSPDFQGMLLGGNAAIRRTTLERVLPYPENLGKIGTMIRSGEDEVIYHRLLALRAKGVCVPELVIYHWIPEDRLTKKYFRKWVLGRGISVGYQMRQRGFPETSLFGIPRYKIGQALRGLLPASLGKSQSVRFTAQLQILDSIATIYGLLVWERKATR